MKHTLGTASLIALLCAAIFMALRPAHAQQWQLPNYGRDHGVVTEPGMPKCNMAVSEECRRLYGGSRARQAEPPRNYLRNAHTDCIFDRTLAARRRGDPRAMRSVEATRTTGTAIGTADFQSLLRENVRACKGR
jgi:hypothetical protein